jgi:hypothetical protein
MYISIKLIGIGETKLFVQPNNKKNEYILVKDFETIGNPYLKMVLHNNHFEIEEKRNEVDEDASSLDDKLDQLALEVIEAIQRGDDLADSNLSPEIKPYNPDLIRVESKTFSLKQIYDMIKSGDLKLHPDFQRNLVWDNFRKSRLIESILLRIPLPMFYFSQDDDGVLSVVDGLQRLSAIYEFMNNKLVLKDLEYLDICNDRTYSGNNKIDSKYFRWFNMTQIFVNIIDPQSPGKVKYDIFRRINTGGRPLNAQELRNCLSRDGLRKTLKEMVALKSFKDATGNSIKDVRMDAQELALRFIYFRKLKEADYENGIEKYSGNIDEELDNMVDEIGNSPYDNLKVYITKFDEAMRFAHHLFGRQAFRRVSQSSINDSVRSVINKALFASVSVILSFYDKKRIGKMPKNCMIQIFGNAITDDVDYSYYLSYGTNGKKNISYAFQKAEELFKQNIK